MFFSTGNARADQVTITYTAGNALQAQGVIPIGGVIPWCKNIVGTPALPANFLECTGQAINNASSPMNGENTPDLRNVFIRGAATSGTTGGASTHSHSTEAPSGDQRVVASANPPSCGDSSHTHSVSTESSLPPYYSVVMVMRIY